jgi:hypothetical protein
MNDLSGIESKLKKLQPAQPSSELFARVEQAIATCRASVSDTRWSWRLFRATPYAFGIGLAAAAAVLLLLARINTDQSRQESEKIAQFSPAPEPGSVPPASRAGSEVEGSTPFNEFIPAGATQVVYNTQDEGLRFTQGSEQPLRQVRYQTRETWQWRNPATGASLRVSYPSEDVVLIPISGQ